MRLCLIVPVLMSSLGVLATDNLCPRTENYTITSMETYTEPVTVSTFTWCLQIPPRCPKTRTEMRQRYRIKSDEKTRSVNECCEGYTMISSLENETGIRCIPICKNCPLGTCISPNVCQCGPGYRGDNCTLECPAGTWGSRCKEKCNCTVDTACNPVNGHCPCPAGLRGHMCDEPCSNDHWGPNCNFACNCNNPTNKCHPETGECTDHQDSTEKIDSENTDIEESNETVNVTADDRSEQSTEFLETENTTEGSHEGIGTTDNSLKTTNPGASVASTSDHLKIRAQSEEDGGSSTARPVIVLLSVPERKRNSEKDRGKFAMKNPFVGHVDDNVNLHNIPSSKTDYVKNIHKDMVQPAPVPLDIALIVVASIVSLGLTSVAVVMVLHMRSKLFETARLSIYDDGKTKVQENAGNNRISSIVDSALPKTPVHVDPLFSSIPEPRIVLSLDNTEATNNYANGAALATLRLSGNVRDLLQGDHYDRPPATRILLQSDFDANTEHVYDEIPLQSSPLRAPRDV